MTDDLINRVIASISPQAGADLEFDLSCIEGESEIFAVVCKGETITFSSKLNDAQVRTILININNKFAANLRTYRCWSQPQRAWAHKMANDAIANATEDNTDNADNAATFAALATAISAVKGRSKSITLSEDCMLSLSRCRGKVWVKNPSRIVRGQYGNGPEFLGSVTPTWGISDKLPDSVRRQIVEYVDSLTR